MRKHRSVTSTLKNMVRLMPVEFLACGLLSFTIAVTAVFVTIVQPTTSPALAAFIIAVAAAVTLTGLILVFGNLSGCHANPAVTLSFAAQPGGDFAWKYVPVYWFSQLLGAIVASSAVFLLFGPMAVSKASLGAAQPSSQYVPGIEVFASEFVFTTLFIVFIHLFSEKLSDHQAAVAIGAALGFNIFLASYLSGGALNPARELGPMIISGKFTYAWSYIFGPLAGSLVASLAPIVYRRFLSQAVQPEQAEQGN